MQIRAETYFEGGVEKLRRFHLDSRPIEIAENIDQWHGADYSYFKVRGCDGNLYILRHEEMRADWELTMYERPQIHGDLTMPKYSPSAEHRRPT